MTTSSRKGFTLIELLVVIAIIGILAAIIIANLGESRTSAVNASIQESVASIRGVAELYYNDNNYEYTDVCDEITSGSGAAIINDLNDKGSSFNCASDSSEYIAAGEMLGAGNQWACIDSSGFAGVVPLSGANVTARRCVL